MGGGGTLRGPELSPTPTEGAPVAGLLQKAELCPGVLSAAWLSGGTLVLHHCSPLSLPGAKLTGSPNLGLEPLRVQVR